MTEQPSPELAAAIARGATPPRRFRTPLQRKVAELIDAAVDDLLMELDNLVRDDDVTDADVTDADVATAIGMEHVDLDDAWTDWCEQEDR